MIRFRSNSGLSWLQIELGDDIDGRISAGVRAERRAWASEDSVPSPSYRGEWLEQLLDRARIRDLHAALEAWLGYRTELEVELSAVPHQSLVLSVRAEAIDPATGQPRFLSSGEKPVLTARIRTDDWTTELRFVTDETCLQLALEELDQVLHSS